MMLHNLTDVKNLHKSILIEIDKIAEELNIDKVVVNAKRPHFRLPWLDVESLYGRRVEFVSYGRVRRGNAGFITLPQGTPIDISRKFFRKFNSKLREIGRELFDLHDNSVSIDKLNIMKISGVDIPIYVKDGHIRNVLDGVSIRQYYTLSNGHYNGLKVTGTGVNAVQLYELLLSLEGLVTVEVTLNSSNTESDFEENTFPIIDTNGNCLFDLRDYVHELGGYLMNTCRLSGIPLVDKDISYLGNAKSKNEALQSNCYISKYAEKDLKLARCSFSDTPFLIYKDVVYDENCYDITSAVVIDDNGEYVLKKFWTQKIIADRYKLKKYDEGFYDTEEDLENLKKLSFEERQAQQRVNNWSFSPKVLNFLKSEIEPEKVLYMGAELEVDSGGRDDFSVKALSTLLAYNKPQLYIMYDGSLQNGFEFATMPATLAVHTDSSVYNYKRAFKFLRDAGYKSGTTSTCGLHVNVSKSFFGNQDKYAYAYGLLVYIMENNWSDFAKFARRGSQHFGQIRGETPPSRLRRDFPLPEALERHCKVRGYGHSKYDAINASKNKVFEFRIFKGTLNPDTYIATLQFVDNLCRLVSDLIDNGSTTHEDVENISFNDIVSYKHYSLLDKYVETFNTEE